MPDFEIITVPGDPAVQRIADVAKGGAKVAKSVLIEDPEPLVACLEAGVEFVEVYADRRDDVTTDVVDACTERNVPIRLLDTAIVNRLFKGDRKARVFGIARIPRHKNLTDLQDLQGDIVVLDGVKIVGNMGAIVRSALGLGASGLVLVDSDLTSIADRRLVRASRGYVFTLPTVLTSRQAVLNFLQAQQFRVAVFDSEGSASVNTLTGDDRRTALVFGSEKRGPSAEFREAASDVVSIDMEPDAESLNVSVSVGIALHVRRSRDLRWTSD